VVGSSKPLGRWNPDNGVKLERRKDGIWFARVDLPKGRHAEYKLCLGSRKRAEKDAKGNDIRNRILRATKDQKVSIRVEAWATGAPRRPNG